MKKIISWNINGISSWARSYNGIEFLENENPDIFCIQEIKSSQEKFQNDNIDIIASNFAKDSSVNIKKFLSKFPYQYYHFADKKGYSGTAIFSKIKPKNIYFGLEDENGNNIDFEGRVIVVEFNEIFLLNVYTPNSKIDFSRLNYRINIWDKNFKKYIEKLKKQKKVIVCGDMNVLAVDIDLQNYNFFFENNDYKKKVLQERASFGKILELGLFDVYRKFYSEEIIFSWVGPKALQLPSTRLDYFLVDNHLKTEIKNIEIKNDYTLQNSSDHFPIILQLSSGIFKHELTNVQVFTGNEIYEKIVFPENVNKNEFFQDTLF